MGWLSFERRCWRQCGFAGKIKKVVRIFVIIKGDLQDRHNARLTGKIVSINDRHGVFCRLSQMRARARQNAALLDSYLDSYMVNSILGVKRDVLKTGYGIAWTDPDAMTGMR